MAVEFLNTIDKRISFSASSIQGLQTKTILIWVNFTSVTGELFGLSPTGVSDEEWNINFFFGAGSRFSFYSDWSTTQGSWYSTNAISTGKRFLALSYDYGSASNNPVMYVDGVSIGVTTNVSPVGTYRAGTSTITRIGSVLSGAPSINGSVLNLCVYNRILTAAEIADAYTSRLAIPTYRGLVFSPQLWGCAGGVTESGTMAAGNTVADAVSGVLGVPSGSPVFKGDTVLTFQS